MLNCYKIAGLNVQMETFGRTAMQAEKYLADKSDSCDMIVSSSNVGNPQWEKNFDENNAEYMKTSTDFYIKLLDFGGMLLHASAVVLDGYAYLFTASSGTGKSTHTQLWCKLFKDEDAKILNDDKPAIRFEDGKWFAYGTPWSGKTDLNLNLRVPLGGIALVERADENTIEPLKGKKAVFALLEQTMRPRDGELRLKVVDLLSKLLETVPVWHLRCNMENEAALVSREAMTKTKPKYECEVE